MSKINLPRSAIILLLTQTFPPDPAAVGQHMGDLAEMLASKGHKVSVLTSDRGYDDTSARYAQTELTAAGADVRRLRFTSFGKATLLHRVAAMMSFIWQAGFRALFQRDLGAIVFTTSPPFAGVIAVAVAAVRNVPIIFWAMDLNPDQLIALGKLSPNGSTAALLRFANRMILRRAAIVIALDDMMAARLREQASGPINLIVIPPWSPDGALTSVPPEKNAFRAAHQLENKTVVMYSGNHSPSNPLTTLLDAAVALRDCSSLQFVFVGSGTGKQEVERYAAQYALRNVLSLPYQPKAHLADSLSAADVHVVSLGSGMAGIIHPCKVYGAMAVARPVIYFGPSPSHVSAILEKFGNGWAVQHGDVTGAVAALNEISSVSAEKLSAMGLRGRAAIESTFNPARLCSDVTTAIETVLQPRELN